MAPRRVMVVAAAVVLIALLAVAFVRTFDGLGDAELVVERAPTGVDAAVLLDANETKGQSPVLAKLLDEASAKGRAGTRDLDEIEQAEAYLVRLREGVPPGGQPSVGWKEGVFFVYRQVS